MEDLNRTQKIAMMRIMYDIVLADGYIDERELRYCRFVENNMEMQEKDLELVKQQNSLLALAEIGELSPSQKKQFAMMMGKLIIADKKIHYNEVKIYNFVCDYCQIDQDLSDSVESDIAQTITYV